MPSTERELHKDSFDSLLCLIDYQALKSWLSLNRHKEKQKLISDLSFTIPLGLNPENSSRILIASFNLPSIYNPFHLQIIKNNPPKIIDPSLLFG